MIVSKEFTVGKERGGISVTASVTRSTVQQLMHNYFTFCQPVGNKKRKENWKTLYLIYIIILIFITNVFTRSNIGDNNTLPAKSIYVDEYR